MVGHFLSFMNHLSPEELQRLMGNSYPAPSVYLIGAGGCGMSGLGHLLLDLGHRVAGSDLVWSRELRELGARGAEVHVGHDAQQLLDAHPKLVVYSPAIRLNNPELKAAREMHLPIVRRAHLLAALVNRQRGICVSGMHGKTTTSALLTFALHRLASAPSYAIGGIVPQFERHALMESDDHSWFVAETDESDGTLTEFHPEYSIVLNIDEEHLDYYANWEAICRQFRQFAEQTSKQLIFCADDERLSHLYARHPRAASFGFHRLATYRIDHWEMSERGSRFEVWTDGQSLGKFSISLRGEKNASNACAVIALLHRLGFSARPIAGAIADFCGSARRQELLFRDDRFCVYDDYGHHPTEIEATLRALKSLPHRRLLVAFQPHRFTRTQHLLERFATCFGQADKLWVTEVYAASEPEIPGINGQKLAEAIREQGQEVDFVPSLDQLGAAIRPELMPGDVLLFLGAGDITKVAHEFAIDLTHDVMQPKEQIYAALSALI